MTDSEPGSSLAAGDEEISRLRAELDACLYENEKLQKINTVLIQRVEMGWGNFSAAYSSFQNAALLAKKVKNKSIKLRQTQSRLQEANFDLSRTREESELSHQRLVDLIESISDAIVLFDENRLLTLANSHFYDFWKDTSANIEVGETRLVDLVPLAIEHGIFDRANTPAERSTHRMGQTKDSVFRLANGSWMKMSERPTSDGGLAVVYTDVTQLKEEDLAQQERALEDKNLILQSMLENMPQGVTLVNANHEIESWNQRFIELTGSRENSVQRGNKFIELLKGTEVYEEAIAFHSLQSDQESALQEYVKEKQLSNGVVLDIRSHSIPGGGYVNTYMDITDRSRSAEALRETERRIRLITDAMPALISYINGNKCYEFANKAFDQWFHLSGEEIKGMYLWQVLGTSEYANHKEFVGRALLGESVSFELEQQLPDQRRRIFNKTYIPHYGAGDVVIGFFALEQDVTEQRRTAEALKHAYRHMEQRVFERTKELNELNKQLQLEVHERVQIEEDLMQATRSAENATESKVKFMAAAGHDLLQPLNAARLFSAALSQCKLPDDTSRLVTSLGLSLDGVESIINTLVDISKLEAGVVKSISEPFVIDDLLSALANEFIPQAEGIGLDFHYIKSGVVVHSDSQLLARILRNFLTNAIRYTDSGKVLLGCRRRPEGLDIQVHDTGIGISEDQLPLIFMEFQRVHDSKGRAEKGLGLGLAIVEKLASVLGCEIFVESSPSRGSVFTVRIPYGRLQEKAAASLDLSQLSAGLAGQRILVIDNEAAICEGMEIVLSNWECDVITVQSLEQLVELKQALTPPPDLVIADYHLDDGDTGIDALEIIRRKLGRSPPAIMITANYTSELRQQVGELGFRMLNKPVKPLKLRSMMTHMLSA